MGEKTGVPFPVMSRIAFGVHGVQIPGLLRGIVAIAWFGIQTYLASQVLQVVIIAVAPGAVALQAGSFLGLSALGWITFLALWAIQVVIVSYGMEMIRKYEAWAGPIILGTFVVLAVWVLIQSGFQIDWAPLGTAEGGELWLKMLGAASLWRRPRARPPLRAPRSSDSPPTSATTLDRAVPLIEDRLVLAGLHDRCASVRSSGLGVLELESDPARAVEAIAAEAQRAVERDRAEVIVLGCGGMAELKDRVVQLCGAPVVDGVQAAVAVAEGLVRLGLRTSKVRTYAPPRPKRITGFAALAR